MLIGALNRLYGELDYLSTRYALNILVLRVDGFTVLPFHLPEMHLLLFRMIQVLQLRILPALKSLLVQ